MGAQVSLLQLILNLLTVRHMECLDVRLVLSRVWDGISLIAHPLVYVGPHTIFRYPNLGENTTKLTPRVSLGASEFDFDIILLRCDRLHTPLLELLLGEETKLLLLYIRCARLRCIDTQ